MFDAPIGLFHRNNMNRNMVLRNKLRSMQMSIYENVTSYFMRITQVHDQLPSIGEKMEDEDLVNVALNGLPRSWEPFVKGVSSQEHFPYWKRLWDACI
jgi:hypothetical protein